MSLTCPADSPNPIACVIFVAGRAFTQQAREFLESVGNLQIEKPFDPARLVALTNERIR